jgi:hypothetical protein
VDEVAVPAKQRLRRDGEATASLGREQACERGEEGTVGRAKLRPACLAAAHREFVAKREQFDLLGESVAVAGCEQPETWVTL